MIKHHHLSLIVGFLVLTVSAATAQVRTVMPGEPVERHLSPDQKPKEWSLHSDGTDHTKSIKVCRVETVCKMRFKDGVTPRTRVKNLVAPLRYENENIPISESFTTQVRQALNSLQDKHNVTVRFVGYTDDGQLTERDQRIYGDQLSLSKARAHRVALAMQQTMGLPGSAIESDEIFQGLSDTFEVGLLRLRQKAAHRDPVARRIPLVLNSV